MADGEAVTATGEQTPKRKTEASDDSPLRGDNHFGKRNRARGSAEAADLEDDVLTELPVLDFSKLATRRPKKVARGLSTPELSKAVDEAIDDCPSIFAEGW